MSGCFLQPTVKSFKIPAELFGKTGQHIPDQRLLDKHELQPEDVLDIIYHFDINSKGIYRIATHDQLDIKFITASEFNESHRVRPDGFISLPYVGDVKVVGLTVEQLKGRLADLYKDILIDPLFYITVPKYQTKIKELKQDLYHPTYGLSREILVRGDLRASFPLIGDIDVKHKTVNNLRKTLNKKYGRLNTALQVDLLLKRTQSSKVFVFGEVRQPGAFPIQKPISILSLIALAGGASTDAELSSVLTLRREQNEMMARVYDIRESIRTGKAAITYLMPDDIVFIPKTRLAETANITQTLSDVILFNGIGFSFSYRVDSKDN
ncbi:polysaccharide biosynthesis/export family protein [Zooshikella harenae]|uniref:Polysaccharide biosynthesis/export family protein n=1 Tax=Zooshikella harenae TaxID=2827238 RepID=A0ABS5ZFC1_9GAMM|nr:polysaccharide biosynthesis/export family protein [Zooshikella harenae]MBU2712763.1 polysaccharide biosynthesis/export family protein [Zooshikella harenae]